MDSQDERLKALLAAAEGGDPEAQIAAGRHFDQAGRAVAARGWFARAAKAGRLDGLRELALNLLIREPIVERDGFGMMQAAARDGDALAAYFWGLSAAEGETPLRWEVALACLNDAAERGLAPAREELALLAPGGIAGFDAKPLAGALPVEWLSAAPRAGVIRGCLPPALCDWLIGRTKAHLVRALVYDPKTAAPRTERARTNSHAVFDLSNGNFVLALLRARILASVAPDLQPEATTILNYRPGEEFYPHFDYLDTQAGATARVIAREGQRLATCLVYLNEDYEGGETDFPRVGLRHRGRKGDALVFWSVTPDGKPDPLTLHAGRPPLSGEKWLVSQWLRERRRPR